MAGTSHNHYETLGVSPSADQDQIRDAYRRLAKQHHPDLCNDGDVATFREAQDAYEALRDPRVRRAYDNELRRRRAYEADLRRRRAYEEESRRRQGGYDGPGAPRRPASGGNRTRPASGRSTAWGPTTPFDRLGAIFEDLFGLSDTDAGGFGGIGAFDDVDEMVYSDVGTDAGRYREQRSVVEFDLHMGPDEAFTGGSAHLNIDGGRTVVVDVPPGVSDGDLVTARFRDRAGVREVRLHIRVV